MQALFDFNKAKSPEARALLNDRKKAYKYIIRIKKRNSKFRKAKEMAELRKRKPQDFWIFFKKKRTTAGSSISSDEFKEYFINVLNDIKAFNIEEVDSFNETSDFNIDCPTYEELNSPILQEEVITAVKRLHKNKSACPSDNLLNEYFIATIDILAGHLTDLFNIIFNSGYFPEIWSTIVPTCIHKKGSPNVPDNFRGITLISNLGKIFTSILTHRVENWFDDNNMLSDAQFGFRKGHSTVDAIFVIHNLIQHAFSNNLRLPCAFIDLKKAFVSVNRNAL